MSDKITCPICKKEAIPMSQYLGDTRKIIPCDSNEFYECSTDEVGNRIIEKVKKERKFNWKHIK